MHFSEHFRKACADLQPDILCMSHLRWDFVFQRPQHIMTRLARHHRVFFFEEPRGSDAAREAHLDVRIAEAGVQVVVPVVPSALLGPARPNEDGSSPRRLEHELKRLVDQLLATADIRDYVLWTYTPMALPMTAHLRPAAVIYDCMDDLAGFAGAPPDLRILDAQLMKVADLVTTGGRSLYEARKHQNPHTYPFPSSIDVAHFARARERRLDVADQSQIPHPRIGFAGVIDERMDLELIAGVADARPDWHLVLLGPVAKIDPSSIPQRPNVHSLGMKPYESLPSYMAGWDAAIMPFAHNAATRFISPTKTPEYLAAGLPVVSTSIRDVVWPYADLGLVEIADTVPEFVVALEAALGARSGAWLSAVDRFLSQDSWDRTVARMRALMIASLPRSEADVPLELGADQRPSEAQ